MSLLWEIKLAGEEDGSLFTKISPIEAQCNACIPPNKIKMVKENQENQDPLSSLEELSTLYKKIMHFVVCTNQTFLIIE